MAYKYENEGESHIRLSHDSKHHLGRMLYIGAHRPFNDSVHGKFQSIAGFCMWYVSSNPMEIMRSIHHDNMVHSSTDGISKMGVDGQQEVYRVLKESIVRDPRLVKELISTTAPFASYGVLEQPHLEAKTYDTPWFNWYASIITRIRDELKA